MKKLLCLWGIVMTTLTASAQNDGLPDGIFTVEWNFNPFDYESKPVNIAEIKARMFLNTQSAVRVGVGIGYDNNTDENTSYKNTQPLDPDNYSITDGSTKVTNKATTLKVSLGYEYHFASTEKLDLYAGIQGGYLGRFYSGTKEERETKTEVYEPMTIGPIRSAARRASTNNQMSYTYSDTEYNKRNSDGDKFNEHGIFGTVFTGIDFYVYRRLYIGAELGVTFNMGKTVNGYYTKVSGYQKYLEGKLYDEYRSEYSSETGITTTSEGSTSYDTVKEHSGKYTKIYLEPSIRIGWMF